MAKQKGRMTFATDILSDMKRKFIRCRIALMISLVWNVIAAIVVFRLRKGKML